MPVHNYAVPNDNRIDNNTVSENIFFKLPKFFGGQRWDFAFKLAVNS